MPTQGSAPATQVPLLDLQAQHASIRDAVMPAVLAVIERQQFIMGPEVAQLEAAIARLSRVGHAIACASGTDALLLPLMALGLKPGDEVITPAFTFFATAGTVHNTGGTPVFVDIERGSFNLSPDAVEAAITPRTRAIIAVHLYGQMAALEKILAVAAKHGLPVSRTRRSPSEHAATWTVRGGWPARPAGWEPSRFSRPRTWGPGETAA